MPLSDTITLNKGQVLLTQIDTSVILLSDSNLQWGEVVLVSDLDDRYSVGDNVLYIPEGSITVTLGGSSYFLVDVNKILFSAILVSP